MTKTRYRIFETEYPYFITCTVKGWLPIFTNQAATDIVLDSWRYLQKERGFRLFAWVVLENHLHLVGSAEELPDVMHRFKTWTARNLVQLLEQKSARTLLKQLEVNKSEHRIESDYQIWQDGGKPKQVSNDSIMWQKIEYIHNNPVKRGFVALPEHWRWSSAGAYAGQRGLIDIDQSWR